MTYEEEVQKIIAEYRSGKSVAEIAIEHALMVAEVYAILIDEGIEFSVPKRFEPDYEKAVKEKDKLIQSLKKDFENAEFQTATLEKESGQDHANEESGESKEESKKEFGYEVFAKEEDVINPDELNCLTEIRRISKKIDDMFMMMKEMQENIGYSKYGSIKKYIMIHETVSVENLTKIFGSYAKNVLYRLADDGFVKKIARGIYKYEGGGNGKGKEE